MKTTVTPSANGTRLLSIKDTTARIGMAYRTAYNKLSDGRFPIRTAKIGRKVVVREDDVIAYIDSLLPPLTKASTESATDSTPAPTPVAVARKAGRPRKVDVQ